MPPRTVGLLHPGEMGAAIGAALRATQHRVFWGIGGRSAATRLRAADAGLEDLGEIAAVCAASDVILSVGASRGGGGSRGTVSGFDGIYVDANAISPSTANRVSAIIRDAGASSVDGGIIGKPPVALGDVTPLRLRSRGRAVVALFRGTVVDARVAGPNIGDASAVKVAYAGWTKGTIALLLTLHEYAARAGVDAVLLKEWSESRWRSSPSCRRRRTPPKRRVGAGSQRCMRSPAHSMGWGCRRASTRPPPRCTPPGTTSVVSHKFGCGGMGVADGRRCTKTYW